MKLTAEEIKVLIAWHLDQETAAARRRDYVAAADHLTRAGELQAELEH